MLKDKRSSFDHKQRYPCPEWKLRMKVVDRGLLQRSSIGQDTFALLKLGFEYSATTVVESYSWDYC